MAARATAFLSSFWSMLFVSGISRKHSVNAHPVQTRCGKPAAPVARPARPLLRSIEPENALKTDYLEKILSARVYDVAIESPLDVAPALSRRLGNTVLLKREDMQPVFSFKLRGAYNKMAHLSPAQLKRGVIAASAGNHAQGVALAAQRLGIVRSRTEFACAGQI